MLEEEQKKSSELAAQVEVSANGVTRQHESDGNDKLLRLKNKHLASKVKACDGEAQSSRRDL